MELQLQDLPSDMFQHIFTFVSETDLCNISLVSKLMRKEVNIFITKCIDERKFFKINTQLDMANAVKNNLIFSIKQMKIVKSNENNAFSLACRYGYLYLADGALFCNNCNKPTYAHCNKLDELKKRCFVSILV